MPTEVALQHCFSIILAIPSLQYRTPSVSPPTDQPLREQQEGIRPLHSTQDKPSEYYYHSSQVLLILTVLNHQTNWGWAVLNKAAIHIQSAAKAFVATACKTMLIPFLGDAPPSTVGKSRCLYCSPPHTGVMHLVIGPSFQHLMQKPGRQNWKEPQEAVWSAPPLKAGPTLMRFLGSVQSSFECF